MSKRSARFINITESNDIQHSAPIKKTVCKKCGFHSSSYQYSAHVDRFKELVSTKKSNTEIYPINIHVAFHFLAPKGSFDRNKVHQRAHEILTSINEDYNGYNSNLNILNNFKYKSIVNMIFLDNMKKQITYLDDHFLNQLPIQPTNIVFEFGNIYYYPIKEKLNLTSFDDEKDIDLEYNAVKQYIINTQAHSISPATILNIWVIDIEGTKIMSFSSFPWENQDGTHGIVINRKVFFPEETSDETFNRFKTVTHATGHYFGLIHVDKNVKLKKQLNLHDDSSGIKEIAEAESIFTEDPIIDPLDKTRNSQLFNDSNYNPMFMNFMDFTQDKYVAVFTSDQINIIHYMIEKFRPRINELTTLPIPKYDPINDMISGHPIKNLVNGITPTLPSKIIYNPIIQRQGAPIPIEVSTQTFSNQSLVQTPVTDQFISSKQIVLGDEQLTQQQLEQIDDNYGKFAPEPYNIGTSGFSGSTVPIGPVNKTIEQAIVDEAILGNPLPTGPVAPGLVQNVLNPTFTPTYGLRQLAKNMNSKQVPSTQLSDPQVIPTSNVNMSDDYKPIQRAQSLLETNPNLNPNINPKLSLIQTAISSHSIQRSSNSKPTNLTEKRVLTKQDRSTNINMAGIARTLAKNSASTVLASNPNLSNSSGGLPTALATDRPVRSDLDLVKRFTRKKPHEIQAV